MKPADKIYEAFRTLIVGAVCIVFAYYILFSLLSEVPLWIKLVIAGLLTFFVYASRDFIMESIKKLFK